MDIEVKDLFYLYEKNGQKVVALRGLHLRIDTGECLVIKGPNGSGKSTLVRLLSGFLSPSAGSIYFDGEDISKIDSLHLRRQFISTIDQKGNLLPELSAIENIALALTLSGANRAESLLQAKELLATNGLEHLSRIQPSQLSSGERQMCSVLAALASDPKILLADEPSGELDNESADRVYELLKSCAGRTTVILVTHDARAERYADRIVRVRDGRVSAQWIPNGEESPVIDPFGWMQVNLPNAFLQTDATNQLMIKQDSEPLVRLNNICLNYGEKELIRNLSLEVRRGEFIAITGPSASGKSSLLRIISGIQAPSSGESYLFNQKLGELSREERASLRRDSVAFLAQGDGPIENISIQEYFPNARQDELGDFDSRKERRLIKFSGGERARIEIYRMLSLKREILIFDEPTSQLDEKQSQGIASLLLKHANEGGVVIVGTRDNYLLSRASRILRLDEILSTQTRNI